MFKSQTTKKIASNTIYQIIGKVISMCVTVFATVLITRSYGRELYGEYSLMQTWPALFFIIVDFGINAIATREISKDESLAEKYLGNIIKIRVAFSLILMLILGIVVAFFPYSAHLKFGIILSLLLILGQALYATTNIIFQVKLRYDLSTIGYLLGYAVILVLLGLCAYFKADIILVSMTYVVGGVVVYIANMYFIKKLGVVPDYTIDKTVVSYLLLTSLPLGIMFVFSQINFKADSIMLSVLSLPKAYGLSNNDSVALYALPYKIFEVSLVIPTFFMNSVYPILVRHMTEGKERLKNTFVRSFAFLLAFGLFSGVVGALFAPLLIKLLGGSEFTQSVLVLQILLSGMVLYFLTQPLSWLIVTLGRQKYLPYIYLISAAFNLTANYIFIPKYSIYASAVITHVSELIILIMLTFVAIKSWKEKYA